MPLQGNTIHRVLQFDKRVPCTDIIPAVRAPETCRTSADIRQAANCVAATSLLFLNQGASLAELTPVRPPIHNCSLHSSPAAGHLWKEQGHAQHPCRALALQSACHLEQPALCDCPLLKALPITVGHFPL